VPDLVNLANPEIIAPNVKSTNLTDYALSSQGLKNSRQQQHYGVTKNHAKTNTNLHVIATKGASSALNLDLQTGSVRGRYTSQGQATSQGRSAFNIAKPADRIKQKRASKQ